MVDIVEEEESLATEVFVTLLCTRYLFVFSKFCAMHDMTSVMSPFSDYFKTFVQSTGFSDFFICELSNRKSQLIMEFSQVGHPMLIPC